MTLKEIKVAIAESSNLEFYQNYELEINYPNINFNVGLKGVVAIYEFILSQIKGYDQLEKLPEEINNIRVSFVTCRDQIINLIRNNNVSTSQWNSEFSRITSISPIKFLYNSPEVEFLIKISQEKPIYFAGAYQYLSGNTQNTHSINHLVGYFLAYEFTSKNFSLIAERKNAEKKSIERIRNDFQNALVESEEQMTDYLAQANQKYIDYSGKIDVFKIEKEGEFYKWYDKNVSDFEAFSLKSNKTLTDLENLYIEKLKLEAPARYWRTRAKKLRREGIAWMSGIMISIGLTVYILILLLGRLSDDSILKVFEHTGTAIKWSILLITTISFLAFAIKSFSKLTFSSFHLMRDAEEKEQLTYVYLALSKEKVIDPTERHLIMQSLFSRADTGLLKDDGSPTMPGNILDKALAGK